MGSEVPQRGVAHLTSVPLALIQFLQKHSTGPRGEHQSVLLGLVGYDSLVELS